MHSYQDLKWILVLWEQRHSKQAIARITGFPRATIQEVIDRYGSVAGLDAYTTQQIGRPANPSPQTKSKHYIISGYMPGKRTYSDEKLKMLVAESISLAEVLRKLDLRPAGGNYDLLKNRIKELDLDTAHFTGKFSLRGKRNPVVRRRTLEEILVKDSTFVSTNNLRKRLLNEGIFEHRCVSCGLTEWLTQPIPLEIDHINGDRRDNRLDNLRLLCPNCHALTATYRGKNKKGNAQD